VAEKSFRESQQDFTRRLLNDLRRRQRPPMEKVAVEPVVWTGKLRDLGDVILKLYDDGSIKADSATQAVQRMCKLFVRPGGKPISAHSVWENTKQLREKRAGRPRS
jgi:hypothetical protein